jgi:sodium transport system ATP-binding protein
MQEKIRVENISKTFILSKKQMKIDRTTSKYKVAVDDLTFSAFSGEIYGLLGPNGAGKTTTLRCISTLIKPDKGDIYVDDYSVVNDAHTVRSKIGFLTSELKLEDFFTPNYLFDFFSKLHGIPSDIANKRKELMFEKFGISDFREVKIAELSTGMRQKIQIVISIVHDPEIIIFDEPTNGLDIITAKVVTDFLIELKNLGKTIIVSTHIFSLVEKICDRVGIILDGKLKLSGKLDEIIKMKSLEDVFFDLVKEEVTKDA